MSRVASEVGSTANSYEILAKLAMGGMAEIFLARGASVAGVERYVVLKRVLRHKASDANFMRMFLDEARLAAQLQHPNIAQVYDIGKLGDSYFFTMEYVHGETVRNLLQRSHALRQNIPISSVLSVIAGAAAGLHHAHDRKGMDGKPLGIVHRDVSPSNLMVSYEGTVKVVDFGVAKATSRDTETRSGTVKGKITYMSPEQCRGGDLDRRSDLFSLGIVMWEMLTTERLFRRNSDFDNMQAIVSEDVPSPSTLRADIPLDVERIVMRMLSKNPADRYQTGDELHEAVEAAAVATGSALSAASLGRFMRELFGQRPEPWVDLQSQMSHPEAHTVTSEPIPGEMTVAPADDLDIQLSAVPMLSQRMTAQEVPVQRPALHTIPLRVQVAEVTPIHRDIPVARLVVPVQHPAPLVATMMMPPAPTMRAHTPSSSSTSGPQYPVLQSSGTYSSLPYSSTSYAPVPQKRSRGLLYLVPAIALSIVVGIALAIGVSRQASPTASVQEAEPTRVALQPGPVEPAHAPIEMAVVPPPTSPPVVATTPPVVTTPPAVVPPPTSPTVAEPTVRPPPPTAPPPPRDKPPTPTVDRVEPAAVTPTAEDIAALLKLGRFDDAVAECSTSSKVVALNATACTLAACKAKEVSKAKRWFSSVGAAKRSFVAKQCGTILPVADPPKQDDELCKREPLACQH